MNNIVGLRPPAWFWAVVVLGLLFEGFGVATYLMHVGIIPNAAEMSQAERELGESMPVWATSAYAVAVFAGLVGALGLLLRKRWARTLLILSLIGLLIQFGWWVLMSGAMEVIGPSMMTAPAIVTLVAILLVWFASHAAARGWLT
jgi:hypothetical protein